MYTFKEIPSKDTHSLILTKHYAQRLPSISYSFGCFNSSGELVGVITFGKPASHQLCIGVCGPALKDRVFELNRLCLMESVPNLASQFVAYALKCLKKFNLIIVSYADTAMGHHGYVYQACNFIYTGATKQRTDRYVGPGRHSRHYDKDAPQVYRVVRSSKHRYVYFTGGVNFKKLCRANLRYPTQEYPKGVNSNYRLGFKLEPTIFKVED